MKTYVKKKRKQVQRELMEAATIQGTSIVGTLFLHPMEDDLEPMTLMMATSFYMESNMEICQAVTQSMREVLLKHNLCLTGNGKFEFNHAMYNTTFDNISWDARLIAVAPKPEVIKGHFGL